jgi:hypothetical protein
MDQFNDFTADVLHSIASEMGCKMEVSTECAFGVGVWSMQDRFPKSMTLLYFVILTLLSLSK